MRHPWARDRYRAVDRTHARAAEDRGRHRDASGVGTQWELWAAVQRLFRRLPQPASRPASPRLAGRRPDEARERRGRRRVRLAALRVPVECFHLVNLLLRRCCPALSFSEVPRATPPRRASAVPAAPRKKTEGVTLISTRHSAAQFPLHPYTALREDSRPSASSTP
jgi:hypothetical protein